MSGTLNSILSQEGFSIPVIQADVKLMLDMFVNQEVAAIVEGINGSGRFGPSSKKVAQSRFQMIFDDAKAFIESNAVGMARLGATRSNTAITSIAYRDGDEGGNAVGPIFQRSGFGNTFQDWDS